MLWKIRHRILDLSTPRLMGIVNITPDSFSDGGQFLNPEEAVRRALTLEQEGADILDLGAESTRPGANPVPASGQIRRLLPVLRALRQETALPISVDTTQVEVARLCLEAGADIINDVSGLQESQGDLAGLIRDYGAGLVLMHRRGNALTMQGLTDYADVVREVMEELRWSVEQALCHGVDPKQIVLDPGIGFAKTSGQSLEILRRIEEFEALGYPILLGPSRKSFLGHVTGRDVESLEFATAAVVAYAFLKKVSIVRVHHAAAMRDVKQVIQAMQGECHVRT